MAILAMHAAAAPVYALATAALLKNAYRRALQGIAAYGLERELRELLPGRRQHAKPGRTVLVEPFLVLGQ